MSGPTRAPTPRILMSIDAVGGVWRYAMDLAASLIPLGYRFVFAGFGPVPDPAQTAEAQALGDLVWHEAPLDWTTTDEGALDAIPALLQAAIERYGITLAHLNLPSQAAGLQVNVPVLAVSHSCVVTWFAAVRGTPVPPDWQWQRRRNAAGLHAASAVVAPSRAHAAMLEHSYGALPHLQVVYNGAALHSGTPDKQPSVFAAGRWWDDGKNGTTLDQAAALTRWPIRLAGALAGPNGEAITLHHAHSLGALSHHDVLGHMGQAAIFASPSLYEPFGLAPLEAAGAGAALVLADNPTYRELWDGAALFAPPRDAAAFAAAIERLSADPALRADLAAKAQERAARFTLPAQANAMHALYARLLPPSLVQAG